MASRGQTLTLTYVAWNTDANGGKTGDVGNHTLRWVKDGTSAAPTNSPAEVDATNAPGVYKITLTAGECTCNVGVLAGKSSTADISIIPITVTFEQLPTAAPDAAGGLPISDAGGLDMDNRMISATATAALEDQYDGTGLLGDTYPLRQDQGASISGGLAVRSNMTSVTVIQGSQQDLANTNASNDTRWTGDDDGAGAEFIFLCTPADTTAEPGDLHFEGYYDEPSGATNGATLSVYNFQTAMWDTHVLFSNSGTDETHEFSLTHANGAPGSGTLETVAYTIGDVLIKFEQDTQETGNACLLADRLYVGFISAPLTQAEITGGAYPLNTTGSGNIGIDWANVENPTTELNLSETSIGLCATVTTNTDVRGTDGANTTVPDAAGTAAGLHTTTDGKLDTLLARITATLFSGITSLAEWLGLLGGKQVGDATARTEIRATGAGSGGFDETTDSLEAHTDVGVVLTTGGSNSVADTVLSRAVENVEDTADKHSLGALIMIVTNGSAAGTVLTAKKPSNDTTFQTYTMTVDASANPITGVS